MVKNPPAMQETWVQSLGQENPLGEGVAGVCLLENPHGQRSLAGYSPWGHKQSNPNLSLNQSVLFLSLISYDLLFLC